jgi:competence protein ComEA
MNPFLNSAVAEPSAQSAQPASGKSKAGRYARHLAFMAGLGLSAYGPARAVDINTATQAQLEGIRGIGPKTAAQIVHERQENGAYASYEDLSERVRGMGAKRLQQFRQAGLNLGPQASNSPRIIVNTPAASKGKAR